MSTRGNAYQDKDIIQSVKLNDAKGKLSVARVIKHAGGTQSLFQQHWPRVRLVEVQRLRVKHRQARIGHWRLEKSGSGLASLSGEHGVV